jgi:hypothetical protein
MSDLPTLIVVADDPQHVSAFIDACQKVTDVVFKMECVKTFAEGVNRFRALETRAVFIGSSLLDGQHLEEFNKLLLSASNVPILVLSSASDSVSGLAVMPRAEMTRHFSGDHIRRQPLIPAIRKLLEPKTAGKTLFTEGARIQITLRFMVDTPLNPRFKSASRDERDSVREITVATLRAYQRRGADMSKMDRPYIPPRLKKYADAGCYPASIKREILALRSEIEYTLCPAEDGDAEYWMVVDPDRSVEFMVAPPVHEVCDSCWKRAAMAPFGWTGRGGGALCCFCGAFSASGNKLHTGH